MIALGPLRVVLVLGVVAATLYWLIRRRLDGHRRLRALDWGVVAIAMGAVAVFLGAGYLGDPCREAKAFLEECGPLEGEVFQCAPCEDAEALCITEEMARCVRRRVGCDMVRVCMGLDIVRDTLLGPRVVSPGPSDPE
jgi:hypothetical protein